MRTRDKPWMISKRRGSLTNDETYVKSTDKRERRGRIETEQSIAIREARLGGGILDLRFGMGILLLRAGRYERLNEFLFRLGLFLFDDNADQTLTQHCLKRPIKARPVCQHSFRDSLRKLNSNYIFNFC
jgi:hypothetical protein